MITNDDLKKAKEDFVDSELEKMRESFLAGRILDKKDFNNDAVKKVYNQFVGVVPDGFTVNVIFELNGQTFRKVAIGHLLCLIILIYLH